MVISMNGGDDVQLEELVATVLRSAKYSQVSPDLIRQVGRRQLALRSSLREAVKATKGKLHQVGGAYFDSKVNYAQGEALLQAAADLGDTQLLRQVCRKLMRRHASTRERLDILDEFYTTILADLPPIHSLMDVACGFNPLAWPWMSLDNRVTYYAYDIYADMVGLLQAFMEIAGINGRAEVRDVLTDPPTQPVDLALVLKVLPCLEQLDKIAVPTLLDALQARHLVISFPAHSLGGWPKGMVRNYQAQFQEWIVGRDWRVKRFEFPSELVFLVQTN